MTHTQTVALVLDATRSQGTIFHTLTEAQRGHVKAAGRAYALAHATGRVQEREAAEVAILKSVGR